MGNLSAPLDVPRREPHTVIAPVKASTTIYKGAMLEYNGGYVQPWNPSDGYPFAGVAESGTVVPIVGSGANVVGTSDGWISIPVKRTGMFKIAYSSAAITNVGALVYFSDDNTLTLSATGDAVGAVADYESGYLWIDITGFTLPTGVKAFLSYPVDLSAATGSGTTGVAERIGTSGSPVAMSVAGQRGAQEYYSTTATSDTSYGRYIQLKALAAGLEAIALRSRTMLSIAAVGNAHGMHATLELDTSAGSVTGLGTGLRANLVLPGRAVAAGGTYYGLMAEIFCAASADISPVTQHAILAVQANGDATAVGKVLNAIAFAGGDGTGKMIYTATDSAPTFTGSIRILVNGAVRYLHFTSAQAANS